MALFIVAQRLHGENLLVGCFNLNALMKYFRLYLESHDDGSFMLFVCDGVRPICYRALDKPHLSIYCNNRESDCEDVFTVTFPEIKATTELTTEEFREFLSKEDPEKY